MISDISYILESLTFTEEELNAITYAQYIAEHINDPINEEFNTYEKEYYRSVAINALIRNIEIYKYELDRIDTSHRHYNEIYFNYLKFSGCLERIV